MNPKASQGATSLQQSRSGNPASDAWLFDVEIMLERIRDAVLVLDQDWRIIYANNRAAEFNGLCPEKMSGRTIWKMYPELADSRFSEEAEIAIKEQVEVDFEEYLSVRRKWFRFRLVPSSDRVVVILADITASKKHEADSRQARQVIQECRLQLETIINDITDGLLIVNCAGELLAINPAAAAFFRFESLERAFQVMRSQETILAFYDYDGYPIPEEKWPLNRALAGERFSNFEVVIERKDSGERWIGNYGGTSIRDKSGRVIQAVVTMRDVTKEEESDRAVRQNQEHFRAAIQAAPVTLWTRDLDLQYTWISTPFEGLSTGEILGRRDKDFLPRKHEVEAIEQVLRKVIQTGKGVREEICYYYAGKDHVFEMAAEPLVRHDGQITGILGVNYDITERKLAERLLREQKKELEEKNQQLEGIFEHGPAGLALFDADPPFRVLAHNRIYQQFFSEPFKSQGMVGRFLTDYAPRAEESGMLDVFRNVSRTGEGKTLYNFPYDGGSEGRIWWNWNLSPVFTDGKLVAFAHMAIDVTEQQRIQMQVSRLADIVASSEDAITRLTPDGIITDWNRSAERIYGYPATEAIGSPISLIEPSDRKGQSQELMAQVQRGESVQGIEMVRCTRENRHIDVSVSISPVYDNHGEIIAFSTIERDISPWKELEFKLRELNETLEKRVAQRTAELEERNRELQQFAYVASHDLQEPLRKILSFGDLLKSDTNNHLYENALFYVDRMQSAAGRMSQLVSDLLAFSRVSTAAQPFVPVNVQKITEEILSDLEMSIAETGAGIEIEANVSCEADPGQLRQVINHLLLNALKFRKVQEKPEIRLHASFLNVSEQLSVPDGTVGGHLCRVVVEDNGIGFDPRFADRIFEPFERLHGRGKYPGTGMGLAICKRIIERHGGTIKAESTPGMGSRFTILIPVSHRGEGCQPA